MFENKTKLEQIKLVKQVLLFMAVITVTTLIFLFMTGTPDYYTRPQTVLSTSLA